MKTPNSQRRLIFLVAIASIALAACGGGSSSNGSTDNDASDSGDINERGFAETLHPILVANCSGCHGENSNIDIDIPKFAHSNEVLAYAVVTNRDLVNRDTPNLSRFVQRLGDDRHQCWTDCQSDVETVELAIAQWNDYVASNSGGDEGDNSPATSIDAFSQTLHPLVTQYCSVCHNGSNNLPGFAADDVESAHEVTLNLGLANLDQPADSRLIEKLVTQNHNCWTSDCESNGAAIELAISNWQGLLGQSSNNPDNNPPVAVNDSFETFANVPLEISSVVINDSDVDADTLLISAFDNNSAVGGAVTSRPDGSFRYEPPFGFEGDDSFDYTVSDGQGGADSATVTITVKPYPGPIAQDDSVKASQNSPVSLTQLMDNDITALGEVISIIAVDSVSQQGGNVALSFNTVTYTPPANTSGTDRFTYTISDGSTTSSAQVTVDINAQPVAISDAVYTYVNTAVNTLNVLDNDRDINNDSLVVSSFDSASAEAGSVSYNGDGSFSYDPPTGFEGTDSFLYIVSDGRGGFDSATVFISVTEPVLRDDDRFLAFLNQSSPMIAENEETAQAYYRAIDPLDQSTTLEAWRNVVGFNVGADATAIYINNNDLGFARRMFVRTDPTTGVVSAYVENYETLEDAQNQDNLIATVAMEHTVAPGQDPLDNQAKRFSKFYAFDGNGNRTLGLDLDGRGVKFVPGLCNSCHGGQPQALVNGVYPDNGDTNTGFIPWDLDTFLFEDDTATVSRANQESQFKVFNQAVLDTDPTPAQRELVEGWYGGTGLPANNFNGGFVPPGWLPPNAPVEATQVYLQSVGPFCRACHVMRGSERQNDIDFSTYEKFMSYQNRIEELVFDESTMPLALRTFDRFWENENVSLLLARHLESSRLLEDDDVLTPGRPIAKPGPFRESALGRIDLNGSSSLFTGGPDAFNWQLIARPAESQASLQDADEAEAFFFADVPGDYTVRLVVNDDDPNTPESAPAEVVIRVSGTRLATSFTNDVAPVFERCAVCHLGFDNPRFNNGDTLYRNVINFVNTDDAVNSPLLTKPSGNHHAGGTIGGFETPNSEKYQLILRWILEGANDN